MRQQPLLLYIAYTTGVFCCNKFEKWPTVAKVMMKNEVFCFWDTLYMLYAVKSAIYVSLLRDINCLCSGVTLVSGATV